MGNVEDMRKVVQDFVAPDLKALAARLEALEKEMGIRFDHVGKEFEHAAKETNSRFDHVEKEMNARFGHAAKETNARFDSLEKEMKTGFDHAEKINFERFAAMENRFTARHETLMATMAANHASIMNILDMDKRLSRLESERNKSEAQHA